MSARRSLFGVGLCVTLSGSMAGCAALPLAAAGTALGLAATAVSTGADVYSLGKLDSAEVASEAATRAAVLTTMDELGLHATGARLKSGNYQLAMSDEKKGKITVTVDGRTPAMTRLRIDVGVFGSEPVARLFLQRVRLHLVGATPNRDDEAPDGDRAS